MASTCPGPAPPATLCHHTDSRHGDTPWGRRVPLPRPSAPPCAVEFSRAPSPAQASGFQRQRCYLKPLLFASLTPAATSCRRLMRAHPGPASQRKAANEEQARSRLFFVLITKRLPSSPSAPLRAVIYSCLPRGTPGLSSRQRHPWHPAGGRQGWRLAGLQPDGRFAPGEAGRGTASPRGCMARGWLLQA